MANVLSGATLYINNELIAYIPNSLKYKLGNPERNVSPQVTGNGNTDNITTEDFSTQKSELMFDLKTTSENEVFVQNWIELIDGNVAKVVSTDGVARIFQKATVINNPEFDTGSDGVISMEMEGLRVIPA